MFDYTQLVAINKWLESNPGVYCARDETTVWKAAHAASGVECNLRTFKVQCRRAGIGVRRHGDGYLIDFSHGRDLVMLGIE